jgi:hypothetical protein
MTEEVRNKLREFFEARLEESRAFYAVVRDYFTERLTDLQLPTFQEFEEGLSNYSLGIFIREASGSNEYGSYSIDRDYYISHKDSPFLDSITDVAIIDFCTQALINSMPDAIILIKFPEVKVTNEYDKSINIQDLYVRLLVRGNKMQGCFKMIRTTYDIVQWLSCYSHSHMPRVDNSTIPHWVYPCLGTGPLNSTLNNLTRRYDEEFLGLFCLELSKYVTVESLSGVPYIRLETVGASYESYVSPEEYRGSWNPGGTVPIEEFIKYFIENTPIKFSYVNGNYALGEPLLDFWIKVSNCFIKWYNDMYKQGRINSTLSTLEQAYIVRYFIISEGKACTPLHNTSLETIEYINHSDLFVFKGVMQKLNIEGTNSFHQNKSILLSKKGCEYILTCILKLINYKYGRTSKEEAKFNKKCFYL